MSTVSAENAKNANVLDWRTRAIPEPLERKTALDYHNIEIDLNNAMANEELVSARDYNLSGASYYARKDLLNPPYYKAFSKALDDIFIRKGVAKRLVMVNQVLSPYGVELFLLDCYRPIELQKEVWDHFLDRAREVLSDPDESSVTEYAGQYCSDPSKFSREDYKTWPTHTTGGACDITLRAKETGEHLFFGSVFDDASEISYTTHFEKKGSLTSSDEEARANRRLLYWAMVSTGFANYPLEWWHYDLGTQMWVMNSHESNNKAYYGYIDSPV